MHWTPQWTTNPFAAALTGYMVAGSYWIAAMQAAATQPETLVPPTSKARLNARRKTDRSQRAPVKTR